LLVFAGVEAADTDEDVAWLANKLTALRVFEDATGRMNLSLTETGGQILLISQFTLYGSLKKGSRPSFNRAAHPSMHGNIWRACIGRLRRRLADRCPRVNSAR